MDSETLVYVFHQLDLGPDKRGGLNDYPVYDEGRLVGTIFSNSLGQVQPECDLQEALRLLATEGRQHMLLVTTSGGELEGVLTSHCGTT